MRNFKFIAMLTTLVMVLSACQMKKPDEGVKQTGTAQTDTVDKYGEYAPKADKKYTIEWVGFQARPLGDNPELIKFFNEKFNVDIKVWNIENKQFSEIFNLKLASGEIPDRIRIPGAGDMERYIDQDILAGLPPEVVKTYAPNIYATLQKDIPRVLETYAIRDGKQYSIPEYSSSIAMWRAPIVWRGDWLKKVGIQKVPETLQEFETALYKFTNEDPDGNGKKDTYGLSKHGLLSIYGAFGYTPSGYQAQNWYEKNGKLVFSSIQPEMKEALKLLNKWYKDGVIDPEFLTGENKGGTWSIPTGFINNKYGLTSLGYNYHWNPPFGKSERGGATYEEFKKARGDEAAKALVFGVPPTNSSSKGGILQEVYYKGFGIGFGKHLEKEPDKIGKILQIMDWAYENDDNFNAATNGLKGKHWDYDNETGEVKLSANVDVVVIGGSTLIRGGINPKPGTLKKTSPPLKVPEYLVEWSKEKKFDVGGLMAVFTPPVPSETKYSAELGKLSDEAFIGIIVGEKPIDYFDEFVKRWRQAGGDQVEKEINDWYQKTKK